MGTSAKLRLAFTAVGGGGATWRAQPENLLLDLDGYVRVTDFGFVKRVARGTKTYTLCGTPDYMAPEIITNKGHNQAADWWSVGVLAYELVAGVTPFSDDNRMAMFKKACGRQLVWPKHFSPVRRPHCGLLHGHQRPRVSLRRP